MVAKKAAPEPLAEDNPFAGTSAPAEQKVDTQALIAKLTQIQKDAQAADRERAAAEAQLAEARKAQKEIDDALTALGVNPESAEQALAELERSLAQMADQFERTLATEREVYRQIAAAQ